MRQTVIENPIINSPYKEPSRHFRFSEEGITGEVIEGRRPSSYFVPVPKAKKKGKGVSPDTEWTEDRVKKKRIRKKGAGSGWPVASITLSARDPNYSSAP